MEDIIYSNIQTKLGCNGLHCLGTWRIALGDLGSSQSFYTSKGFNWVDVSQWDPSTADRRVETSCEKDCCEYDGSDSYCADVRPYPSSVSCCP